MMAFGYKGLRFYKTSDVFQLLEDVSVCRRPVKLKTTV